ncbi:SIMPL domain-containing protein [Microbacterium sp. 179-B 1A2 NHS]|uniref:SIMPL domain-containing protein n=1 Tax=Microbacterium sp. 179-B 1A2 NHS TaxID=3142383 RepID=UPI0039A3AAE0
MTELIITVRGESEARVAAETAVATLVVAMDGHDRAAVVEQAAALVDPIRSELAARAEARAIEEWSAQQISVWSDRPWNERGTQLPLVHHASVALTATFTDFAALSEWLSTLAERSGVQVGGVEWQLTPATRLQTERDVATDAVAVAVHRATAYAEAIGKSTVEALEIADVGLLVGGDAGPQRESRMARAAMTMDAGGGTLADFRPEAIVVSAAVEARFRAS